MEWPTPKFSRKAVNRAGKLLAFGPRHDLDAMLESFDALANCARATAIQSTLFRQRYAQSSIVFLMTILLLKDLSELRQSSQSCDDFHR